MQAVAREHDIRRAVGFSWLVLAACSYPNPAYNQVGDGASGDPTTESPGSTSMTGMGSGSGPISTTTQDPSTSTGESETEQATETTTGPAPMCGDGIPAPDQLCFGEPVGVPLGGPGDPRAVLATDIDGDNDDDLLVTFAMGGARWFRGAPGMGGLPGVSFMLNPELTAFDQPLSLAVMDIDGQGLLDVLVADQINPAGLKILVGDSVPLLWLLRSPGLAPTSVAVGELVSNGALDVAVALDDDDEVAIYDGDGLLEIGPPQLSLPTCAEPNDLALADLDGDGALDIIVVCRGDGSQGMVRVHFNDGGSFSVVDYPDRGDTNPEAVVVDDYDGDGRLDVLVTRRVSHEVALYLNAGDGSLLEPDIRSVGNFPEDLAVDDFDGDGDLDVVVAAFDDERLEFLLQPEDGGLGDPHAIDVPGPPFAIAVGRFNADDLPDVAVSLPFASPMDPPGLVVLYSDP